MKTARSSTKCGSECADEDIWSRWCSLLPLRYFYRSLTAPHGSTLPLGTIKSELRLMSYLIADHEEIVRTVEEKRVIYLLILKVSLTLFLFSGQFGVCY